MRTCTIRAVASGKGITLTYHAQFAVEILKSHGSLCLHLPAGRQFNQPEESDAKMGMIEFLFGDDGRDFRPPLLGGRSGHFFSVVCLAPALCSPPISPLAPALCLLTLAEP